MRPHRPRGLASPAAGVFRGLRAGVLAVLCVLLPLAGHVLAQCHAPRWIIVAGTAAVAVPGATVLTRRRLTDTQVLAVLAAAQLACHAAYSLPGACAAVAEQGGAVGGLARLVEHDAVAGPSPGVVSAGQTVTLLLAARLLGPRRAAAVAEQDAPGGRTASAAVPVATAERPPRQTVPGSRGARVPLRRCRRCRCG
ncbi:hypothetical protein OG542_09650 [Streptomyces violaceus]|uniref:hypothetical protein n=1 Tax=Streptomyces violaceus TaxID=1936 RepID=UPI002E237847